MRALRLLAAIAAATWALGAAAQADPNKVIRVAFRAAETGFDPQVASDIYSGYVIRAMFEPLLRYDYRARPHVVVPNTAATLPESSADGTTWTIRVKPGTYFIDDPAFKGRQRELTAADYAYSWKRTLDPRMRSPHLDVFDGRIVGMDAVLAKAKVAGRLDYDAPVEGLQLVDRYTLKLKLNYPWFDLPAELTGTATSAVAREVVEAYGDASGWVMANPVGTGPYQLADWRQGQRIVLTASPSFRGLLYVDSNDPADRAVNARFKGKHFPLIGRVEAVILDEGNPRLLAFEKGELDVLEVPYELVPNVMQADNRLQPRFAKAGVLLERGLQPSITYTYFNMEDPVLGGYASPQVALRRAVGMGYNVDEEIRVIRQGQGTPATQVLPPGVAGYDAAFNMGSRFDPAGAKALLDKFGYIDRDKDGWRDLPDGKPLVLKKGTSPSALERQYDELWQRNMTAIGIRMEFVTQKWPDLLKMARGGQLQIWQLANTSATTAGNPVLGLLYGPNAGLSNLSRFKQPDFDRLYDASRRLPDGAARTKLVREMSQLVAAYAPWTINAYRYENIVAYPWVIGYKYNGFNQNPWQYLDIDRQVPRKFVE